MPGASLLFAPLSGLLLHPWCGVSTADDALVIEDGRGNPEGYSSPVTGCACWHLKA